MGNANITFLVDKNDLFKTAFADESRPNSGKNEVILKIDKYAFTANNITYAVVGEKMGYWQFFPAEEPYGIVPVWGFADVVSSNHENISLDDRYYGYFPMSTYLKVNPENVKPFGFVEGSEHRQSLPAVYNYYTTVSKTIDDTIDYHPIIKPLFLTSFLNYYYLKDEEFFKADQIILTSASSKTALSLAFLLKNNQVTDKKQILGLTSEKNVDFVASVGFYDNVTAYNNFEQILNKVDSIVVDFAGNSYHLKKLHDYLDDLLKHICLVGLADWSSGMDFKSIPNAKFFFAPDHAEKRYREMGVKETTLLANNALQEFIITIKNWMELNYIQDREGLCAMYLETLKGNIDPSKGHMVQLVE